MDLRLVAAAVAGALVVGAASGAWINGLRWSEKYASLERDQAVATTAAVEKARQEERDARATADDVRGRPVVRVRCYAENPGVPAAGAGSGGVDLPGHAPARDGSYEHDLRELVAAALANRKLGSVK